MWYGRRLRWPICIVVCVLATGCASKKQATQLPPPPTGNPIIDTSRGAGRTVVNGTKNGFQSMGRGIKSLVDPSSAASADPIDPVDPDRTARDDGDDTTVRGGYESKSTGEQASKPRSSTKVTSRDLDVPVVDTLVIE